MQSDSSTNVSAYHCRLRGVPATLTIVARAQYGPASKPTWQRIAPSNTSQQPRRQTEPIAIILNQQHLISTDLIADYMIAKVLIATYPIETYATETYATETYATETYAIETYAIVT
jgi:hypothetical protein